MRRILPVFAALLCAPAVGQIRVVNYNTLDGPTPGVHDNSANMSTVFAGIAAHSVNGIAKRPDLIILQEQTNTSAAALAALLNTQYGLTGAYVAVLPAGQPSSSDPIFIDRQAFVYDTTALQLIGSGTSIATGAHRPVIRGQFRPVGYTSTAASFYAYGAHLMASDPDGRALQTSAMRANSNALGEVHALYAGDFNMQNNQETAWQNMVTGAGAGLAIDPLNPNNNSQTWNNNSAFASIHTQSTRTGATPDNDGGATGGMDDRFDVQLSTQEFHDGEGLSYIANTYRAYGQDGQHFNSAINTAPFPLGSTIANALWDASDHLPVVADYQLPARMAVSQTVPAPARVIVARPVSVAFQVRNAVPVTTQSSADELDYTVEGTGVASTAFSGSTPAATAGNTHFIALDTSSPGDKAGTVNFLSNSQGVADGAASFSVNTRVLAGAQPSFGSIAGQTHLDVSFGDVWALGADVPNATFTLSNVSATADPAFTAGLDVDAIIFSPAPTTAVLNLPAVTNLPAGSVVVGSIELGTGTVGIQNTSFRVNTSDENVVGAQFRGELLIGVYAQVALPGDAFINNVVDINDFAILASNFNQPNATFWGQGDFNRDDRVDIADFAILSANFNRTAPRANVPEPAGLLAAAIVILRYSEASSRLRNRRRSFGVPQDDNCVL